MSNKSYTASERRGVIAIAFLALLITALGLGLSLCGRRSQNQAPEVSEMTEIVDSASIINGREKNSKKAKIVKGRGKSHKSKKSKNPKTYRRRSPLDEPI